MAYTKKRKADLTEDIWILLGNLCIKGGFCNRLEPEDLITPGHVLHAEDFARAIIEVEGLNPDLEIKHKRWIKREFTERYGESVSYETYFVDRISD